MASVDNADKAAASGRRVQPLWQLPEGSVNVGLQVYNSLTRKKEPFIPQNGRNVLWYSCGPTVYDDSHMGHARSYISFDILRRVLKDYFNFNVLYVMNITDIDDKIIKRARQRYLMEEYLKKKQPLSEALKDTDDALTALKKKLDNEQDPDKRAMYERLIGKVNAATELASATKVEQDGENNTRQVLLESVADVLSDWLDKHHGSQVTENSIFAELPKLYEKKFHEDMDALNVLPPDVLTRVSEYIPEVIEYVQKIIDQGFGYESNGSVYFDTVKFSQSTGHYYAKLVPEAYGDAKALEEGEGDLSVSEDRLSEKRNTTDFALWKSSKPGEPSWDSPWGKGRPGWHIECSVMASSIIGDSLDIHTGGVDLKFPHHDNELAQAEAYFNNDHWVRYFLHSGHLTISGCKMSKSLKNFITIKEALNKHTARQLRLMFLLHSWKDTLDYGDDTMTAVISYEKTVDSFFWRVKNLLRSTDTKLDHGFAKWLDEEKQLFSKFQECEKQVHECLCDSFDTRGTLDALRDVVSASNIYIERKLKSNETPSLGLLKNIAVYITRIFKMFGAIEGEQEFGFPTSEDSGTRNVEDTVMPYLTVLASFRDEIRAEARRRKDLTTLDLCDRLRDNVLPDLGVQLEDHEGIPPSIKIVGREKLLKEREAKLKQQEAERQKAAEKARENELKEELKKIPPSEMFRKDERFSQFDEKGFPTHDASGLELSKGQAKKLMKLYDAQMKKYNEYLKTQQNASN